MPTIHVSALWLTDEHGRVLAVRKRGTTSFMNPGGKPEPGESPEACVIRELREEVGLHLGDVEFRGRYVEPAANEPDHLVDAMVYTAQLDGVPVAAAEIAELRWLDPAALPADGDVPGGFAIAPLLRRLAAEDALR